VLHGDGVPAKGAAHPLEHGREENGRLIRFRAHRDVEAV